MVAILSGQYAFFLVQILVEECDHARMTILNRPKQLNALSHWMVLTQTDFSLSFPSYENCSSDEIRTIILGSFVNFLEILMGLYMHR